ncbi:MAG: SRPBCC family protein [Candidatus Obscuribacterales bacterium]|nr:SRPBCC family protein [Candidatus Obscuribacterales bacterium]
MKKSIQLLKKTTLLTALAAMAQLPALADGAEMPKTLSLEETKNEPLVTISPAEKNKLGKGQVVIGTKDRPNGRRWVTAKIKINAQPQVVWDAVHEERKSDPDLAYSKVLEEKNNEKTIEQKFQLLPVIGTSVCVIKSNEIQNKRIDYYLLKSDRFKAVEGSWILQPTEDGGTVLELGSYIDIGVPAPRGFVENIAGKKLERRVSSVRRFAEAHADKAIAHSKPEAQIK